MHVLVHACAKNFTAHMRDMQSLTNESILIGTLIWGNVRSSQLVLGFA